MSLKHRDSERGKISVCNRLDKAVLEVSGATVTLTPEDAREIARLLGEAADRAEQTPPDEFLQHRL
ncbi:hypothetical protein [Tomitella fengzijianii]|uniref:Uncharacterized protein n=1 Tax=Tomitella fengzijianii TaxID=2597660 RepID=A0A516X3Y9_9ACTN|nr:hypothetical protein [Tomitella fengzijianii]QDQ97361.1 hypothetical protein FO059_08535 [Tomitella fengzijianii]